MKLVLASASPRRKELLRYIKEDFAVIPSTAEENASGTPEEIVRQLSELKARSVFDSLEDKEDVAVLGSDTIVVLDGEIMGKPKDEADAKRMLRALSGRVNIVYTGVAVVAKDFAESGFVKSDVYFDVLSDEEIDAYIKTGDPMDKAGAYGLQSIGGKFLVKIEGDWSAVMGLPLNASYRLLKKYGVIE